jgi:DeoR family transcriptional regulator, glycerol-3-phosphate regulon repressor
MQYAREVREAVVRQALAARVVELSLQGHCGTIPLRHPETPHQGPADNPGRKEDVPTSASRKEQGKPAREIRQGQILELVGAQGFMSTDALARRFNVTTQTIRADINRLCRDGRLRRYHGGAGLVSTLDNASFAQRRVLLAAQKQSIAAAVARRIPNHASVFLHYGTTMEAVAAALQGHRDLLILTNNISSVAYAPEDPRSRVMLAGGDVSTKERCTWGAEACDFLARFNVDFGLLSVGCVGTDGALFEFGFEASRTARTIIEHSRQVYLAVDHLKFDRQGLVRLGHLSELTTVFTDRAPSAGIARLLAECEVELEVVSDAD